MKGNKKKRSSKPNTKRGLNKNQRRDVEIEDTAKREFKADARERRDCYKSEHNDPAWYAQNSQLMRDFASFPFGNPLGNIVSLDGGTYASAFPGVMTLYVQPSVGRPVTPNDPVNIAMRNIYSFVRHANSGHSNYDAPDLMMYLLAMDSVYMFHSFMKRIVGLVLDYDILNRYYPKAIVESMGVDFDDISANIQDFRGFVNEYAVKMGSMCVPNSMSYMARHTWMMEGLYTDGTASKSQTYLYTLASTYKFGLDASQVGKLIFNLFYNPYINPNKKYTFSDLRTYALDLLNPILSNEDMNIMSGDILKAFGVEGIVKVTGVGEGYVVVPTYSEEVLSQIENATILGGYDASDILQNTAVGTGYLTVGVQAPSIVLPVQAGVITGQAQGWSMEGTSTHWKAYTNQLLLNFHHTAPTPEQVMVATRLSARVRTIDPKIYVESIGAGYSSNPVFKPTMWQFGSELCVAAAYTKFSVDFTGIYSTFKRVFGNMYQIHYVQEGAGTNGVNEVADLATFDWHPQVYAASVAVSTTSKVVDIRVSQHPIVDVDNYTTLTGQNLENLNLTALLSEFSVPQMGAFSI